MRLCLVAGLLAAFVFAGCETKPASDSGQKPPPGASAAGPGGILQTAKDAAKQVGMASGAAMQVEIGCAMCVYKMSGVTACVPALKMGEKVVLLSGYSPADAHALCEGAKKAKVEGRLEGDTFVATKVDLLP